MAALYVGPARRYDEVPGPRLAGRACSLQTTSPAKRSPMSVATDQSLQKLSVDTIRTLSMDAVEKANSGHPGTPMALAPVAYALYTRVMKHDPADTQWIDRDRFVLSAGHACMLLYSTLFLT